MFRPTDRKKAEAALLKCRETTYCTPIIPKIPSPYIHPFTYYRANSFSASAQKAEEHAFRLREKQKKIAKSIAQKHYGIEKSPPLSSWQFFTDQLTKKGSPQSSPKFIRSSPW